MTSAGFCEFQFWNVGAGCYLWWHSGNRCLIISRQMEPNNTNVAEEAAVINAQALEGLQPCFLLFYQRKCESTVFPSTGLKWVSLRLATLSGARVVARHRSYASREEMTNKWPFHLEKKNMQNEMKWKWPDLQVPLHHIIMAMNKWSLGSYVIT